MTSKKTSVFKRTSEKTEQKICRQQNTDTKKKQTKTKRQEHFEFILTKSLYSFSLKPPLETEYEKSAIAVSKLEVYNSVFIKVIIKIFYNPKTWILGRSWYFQNIKTNKKQWNVKENKLHLEKINTES